ncbi:hypothetical protein ASD98_23620 [Flavobacterium sp. Root186]|nr:hypothetical protein ASD98_23620 [Flavobacterium sp. Root186]
MRLSGQGNLGIGSNAPASKLHVAGDMTLNKDLKVGGTATTAGNSGTDGQVLISKGSGNAPTWVNASALAITGDNLGNHIATKDLDMNNKNINNINTANMSTAIVSYAANIKDRNTQNTKSFIAYKDNGNFGLYNEARAANELIINETTGKTTVTSAQIAKGTDGAAPELGAIAVAADTNGNVVWKPASTVMNGVIPQQAIDEFTATAGQTSFTLTATPSTLSKVKLYINGVRIDKDAISVSGNVLTYNSANNGSYALMVGDNIMIDYLK